MMQLAGRTVRFWLSHLGKAELSGVIAEQDVLEAYVADQEQQGVWIWLVDSSGAVSESFPAVILVRWSHFNTASTEYIPQAPPERPRAGFWPH